MVQSSASVLGRKGRPDITRVQTMKEDVFKIKNLGDQIGSDEAI